MGADWPLVQDALVIATLAVGSGVGLTVLALKLRGKKANSPAQQAPRAQTKSDLEERVRVLERIATDRPTELAEEIEALRNKEMETN